MKPRLKWIEGMPFTWASAWREPTIRFLSLAKGMKRTRSSRTIESTSTTERWHGSFCPEDWEGRTSMEPLELKTIVEEAGGQWGAPGPPPHGFVGEVRTDSRTPSRPAVVL